MDVNLETALKAGRARLKGLAQTLAVACVVGSGFTAPVSAQSENTVTLKYDGGEDITGELIEESNGMITIASGIGVVAVPIDGLRCIGAACPEGTRLVVTGPTLTVTAINESVKLTGQLLEISNGEYVLATDFGEVRIKTDMVNCEGEGCLENSAPFVFGGEVSLIGSTGTLTGKLSGIEDGAYVLDSPTLGLIRVKSELYQCEGEGCPPE